MISQDNVLTSEEDSTRTTATVLHALHTSCPTSVRGQLRLYIFQAALNTLRSAIYVLSER
jgi:hypothetical protein